MADRYYLYGIFPAPGPTALPLDGLDAQPMQVKQLGDFTFLYSIACQKRYLSSRKNLLGHEKVLEAAMEQGHRTLLPLQFGLIVESWEQVQTDLVEPHAEDLVQLFERLNGCREVSIKVQWDPSTELERMMVENADLQAQRDQLEGTQLGMEQVIFIGQQIENALEERKQGIVEQFRQVLTPLAKDVLENPPQTDVMIYNAAFLIPWNSEAEFGQAIDTVDQSFGDRLRIRYNNFTAPYNFAQLQ
ncbi:GvpL/GvpF family gas vesicle protein [Nodosilinea sp. LEGE 07088]|uniref:gas vesicle protein GvpF n=1 Tax=Nodosilinea sp. LEGE 07088 TaxID=2777968 RepID=UPI00187F1B7F|nr:GvpL/GvpF family gas vesicle protein [Nodosilinea sp. LEGE 07088]MBE9138073.1 GvpL/GvpF family gas vesicle protein [Nodosilinea sp. LEGE 07088]